MVVAPANILGVHGLFLYCRGVAHKLQDIVKVVNHHCGDYYIQEKSSFRYFHKLIKFLNKREDKYEIQTRQLRTELVKVSVLRNNHDTQSYISIA